MNKIKEYRIKARMTQSDLSAYLEIPTRTIEDWETEKRNPSPWAEELIIRQLEELIHPCLMKRFLDKCSHIAYDRLLGENENIFTDSRDFSHDEYYKIVHEEMKKMGVEDSDYDYCPKSIDHKYLENVQAGREIHETIL
jgi:DNA-binding XRE family transcriptional regulator